MNKIESSELEREESRLRAKQLVEEKKAKEIEDQERKKKNREKAQKAFQKKYEKGFWEKYKDYFAYGALGMVVLFILVSNFTGDRRKLSEIPVNEEEFIIAHNDVNPPFKLGKNEFFEGMTLANVKEMANNLFSTRKSINRCNPKLIESVALTNEYNFYKEFPECRFEEVTSKCSGSYVEVPLSIYRSRSCKAGGNTKFIPSAQYLFTCDTKHNSGCKGGYIANSLDFMMKQGLVTETCWNEIKGEGKECPSAEKLKTCEKEYVENYCVYEGVDDIKKEIAKNGPVASFMIPFRDLLVYNSGSYEMGEKQKIEGMVFVKIVGWETNEDGTQSWLIDPLWGKSWGEDGLARVLIGTEESILDKMGFVVLPTAQERKATEEETA